MKLVFRNLILLATVLATAGPAAAANVALRARSFHEGTMIRLGDVADISAASTAEVDELSTTVLMPAPAPGTMQFLRKAEIRELLAARGIDVSSISLDGAEVVEVQAAKPQLAPAAAAQSPPAIALPSREEIEASLDAAIKQYLTQETSHDRWVIKVNLNMAEYLRLANLGFDLQAVGGRKPYTGSQSFQISGQQSGQRMTVLANVVAIQPVVVVLRRIESGELIRATDLEIRQHEGALPGGAIRTLADAVGMEATRSIAEGAVLTKNQLSAPLQVERGETVTVFARTAGITVRTFAIARQNGAQGELVQVETLDGKERITARVSGRRELEVLATGATAGDFATLPRHETTRR